MLIWSGTIEQVWARKLHNNERTAEAWAWAQIKQGREVNLNERCNTRELDPRADNESRWINSCRQISAAFLVDVLTKEYWRNQVPFFGVNIVGARIVGDIDLRNAKLDRAFFIDQSRIENNIYLDAAQTDSILSFSASRIAGVVSAMLVHGQISLQLTNSNFKQDVLLDAAKFDGFVDMAGAAFDGNVSLRAAKIDGFVNMDGATFNGNLDADGLQVGASLLMRSTDQHKASFQTVDLGGVKITGDVAMTGATFDGNLNAGGLQIAGSLSMISTNQNKARFKAVDLTNASVAGSVDMIGATFEGDVSLNASKIDAYVDMDGATVNGSLNVGGLRVGASLLMRSTDQNKASFQTVDLGGAKISGDVAMTGATFDGNLNANSMQIAGSLFMNSTGLDKARFKAVNLTSAKVTGSTYMSSAMFDGDVSLNAAKIDGFVNMDGATFDGNLDAEALQVGASLFMNSTDQNKASFQTVDLGSAKVTGSTYMSSATFGGDMSLNTAKIDGFVNMDGATFNGNLDAEALQVGASLFMRSTDQNKASFKAIDLAGAKISGDVAMTGATFDGILNADSMQIAGSLFMNSTDQNKASFQTVDLESAKVVGDVTMSGATFGRGVSLNNVKIGGYLEMSGAGFTLDGSSDSTLYGGLKLGGAMVAGDVYMTSITFDSNVNLYADMLQVGGNVFMQSMISGNLVSMKFSRIGGSLDLRSARLHRADISGATISGDLRLGRVTPAVSLAQSTTWYEVPNDPGGFNLDNTRTTNLVDQRDAWPRNLNLDGFSFVHLGGSEGDTGKVMRDRGGDWWDSWIRRDLNYSPGPYEQLAAAFVSMGDRVAADEIHYLGRVRQRENTTNWSSWIIQYVAGFGIGDYTFRVIWWVLGIAVLGAAYLWISVKEARMHGPVWCFGASLARLLPVIEINKEFTDFFNDAERKRLTAWQSFIFSIIGLVGWLLGAILIAAISGLTQKP